MKVFHQIGELRAITRPLVLAIGSFDGVHRGHRQIIAQTLAHARLHDGEGWALTFDPHPARVIRPQAAPALLTSTDHKLRLLEACGLHGCVVMSFTQELARLEPSAFVEEMCRHMPTLAEVVVGTTWTFGHRGRGNAVLLQDLAAARSFEVTVVEPVYWKERPISSTRIRQDVQRGHLDAAAGMLGRTFSILGTVARGRQYGRSLGFPTANLDPHSEVLPPAGIYAVRARMDGRSYDGVAYRAGDAGRLPAPHPDIVEVHLFDVEADLYGRVMELAFVDRLREDRRFEDPEALKRQIALDVEHARAVLKTCGG